MHPSLFRQVCNEFSPLLPAFFVTVHGSVEAIVKSAEILNVDLLIRKEEQTGSWITRSALLFLTGIFMFLSFFVDIFSFLRTIHFQMEKFIHMRTHLLRSFPSSFFPH